MAQLAESDSADIDNKQKQKALCPFYGSSHGCPYLNKCELSHTDPNSIQLCPAYQTMEGCPNPSSCYYRHSLLPLSSDQVHKLTKKHKIAGKIHYSRVIKGKSVHRVIIIINQILWYGIHFIIEDDRLQKIHYQKYSSIYFWNDAVLVSEMIGNIIINSECPGKYLSYLKNLIDGDVEPDNKKKKDSSELIHYRDILASIGTNYNEIPKPINPHLVGNLSRVPWIDFKLLPLPFEVYDYPDIYLKPGDLVRIWRPKKFVSHCGVYLGNKRIIHISNGVKGDDGMRWSSMFQSGSSVPTTSKNKKYYDYGKKIREEKQKKKDENDKNNENDTNDMNDAENNDIDDAEFDKININDVDVYDDDDDMDLVDDDEDDDEQQQQQKQQIIEKEEDENKAIVYETYDGFGEKKDEKEMKEIELLYQDIDEFENNEPMTEMEMEHARRARECEWSEFLLGSRKKDLELGFFVFPWRTPSEIVYTAQFLTEIHYMKGQYSVYKNNCEHFALYCCTGLRYSPQANTIENIVGVASKISSFAGSIFSKVTSFRKSNKNNNKQQEEEKQENDNHKNHPVIQNQKLDDGGDDELEKILLNDNKNDILVMSEKKKKKKSPKILNKPKKKIVTDFDLIDGDNNNNNIDNINDNMNNNNDNDNDGNLDIDEYANDEEDVLAESIILDTNQDINKYDVSHITPGGLTQSEILVAQKHHNQQKWNV